MDTRRLGIRKGEDGVLKRVGSWYKMVVIGFLEVLIRRGIENSKSVMKGDYSHHGVVRLRRQACIEMTNLGAHMICIHPQERIELRSGVCTSLWKALRV